MNKQKLIIDISDAEVNRRLDEIEASDCRPDVKQYFISALKALVELDRMVGLKSATIARLRKVFGKQSEKTDNKKPEDKKPAVGHTGGSGRRGADGYPQAHVHEHQHESLKAKDQCPECRRGKLYPWDPGLHLRVTGNPPLTVTLHKTEKLRCNLCGQIFEAQFKEQAEEKFDAQAKAIIALLHYKSSLPFHRLSVLQKELGLPFAKSTLWSQVAELGERAHEVWKAMLKIASHGKLFYIDDTTAKVLELMRENELNRENKKHRSGMYTTGVLSELEDEKGPRIVLYFTGRMYSGENIRRVLEKREMTEEPFAVMSDALKQNHVQGALEYLCLVHGRRQFKDVETQFEKESKYVLDLISRVYAHEKHCKEEDLSAQQRLEYHQQHSAPVMQELKHWIDRAFKDRLVEPNSILGGGIKYMQRHWSGLTAFLRHPSAPLDNNLLEMHLRVPVLNRKNWLFYKTTYGALIGDILLSLIKTCEINKVNAMDYLVAIQNHNPRVKQQPEKWMPWNYTEQIPMPAPLPPAPEISAHL